MKIAVITWNYNKLGGIERCVYELVEELCETNEVHIFANDEKLFLNNKITFHNVPIIRKHFILKTVSFFIISAIVFSKVNRKEKFDVIHLHNPSFLRPHIYTVHSVHEVGIQYQESQFPLIKKYLYRLRTFHCLIIYLSNYNLKQKNVHLVAISNRVRQEIKLVNNKSPQISVIYHGVNVGDFKKNLTNDEINEIKEKLGISRTRKIIMFAANEFKRKGLDILLKSLQSVIHNDWHLLIIGQSNDGIFNTSDALKLVNKLNISEKCSFLGKSDNLGVYYSISDLFVLPTQYEPLGMVFMEALASGLATIIPEIAGASEIIRDGIDGIVIKNPIITSELSLIIEKVLTDDKNRLMLATNGQNKIVEYTWRKSASNYEKIYEKIIV